MKKFKVSYAYKNGRTGSLYVIAKDEKSAISKGMNAVLRAVEANRLVLNSFKAN